MVYRVRPYCTACKRLIPEREIRTLRLANFSTGKHLSCLTDLERYRVLFAQNMRCLFCGHGAMTPAELVDHFNREHGRVLVNW